MDKNVEPPQRKRKVEETSGASTTEEKINFGGFVPEAEWIASQEKLCVQSSGWSDDEVDPVVEEEYYRRIEESDGFDVGEISIPYGPLIGRKCRSQADYDCEVDLCAQVGLHCFNFQKGTNLRLMSIPQYTDRFYGISSTYFITSEAIDLVNNSRPTFQTCATFHKNNEPLRIETEACRFKPATLGPSSDDWKWDDGAIDDYYKGNLPDWLSDDPLMDKEQYYEVQDSDMQENDWLQLYSQLAFYSKWELNERKFRSSIPLEIKKVVVQTREAVEPRLKLKALNAIFYMSFRDTKCPNGSWVDYRAIVRRTMDGKPGHVRLEVQCWRDSR